MRKQVFLVGSVCLLIGLVGIFFLHSMPLQNTNTEAEEESKAKHDWMLQMLADPATGNIPEMARMQELLFLKNFMQEEGTYANKYRNDFWQSRGPWNVGGRTRAIAIDHTNPLHILIGSVSGGIWQSTDGGKVWNKVSSPIMHPGIVSITQDPRANKANIWYALSGELYGTSASATGAFHLGDGAYRSTDNGNTWQALTSTSGGVPSSFSSNFQGGWRIVASPVDTVPACVYMAVYGQIYRSIDTGNTWNVVLGAGNNDSYCTDVAVDSKGITYATLSADGSVQKGFFRSQDGIHFTNITPAFIKNYNRCVMDINPNNENEVYFLMLLDSANSGGIVSYNYEGDPEYVALLKYTYLSGDGSGAGGKWINLSNNLPVTDPDQFDKFNCQGAYDLCVRVQPKTNTVIIGGTNLYRSTDGFTTPNNTSQIGGYGIGTQLANFTVYPTHHPDQHDIKFVPNHPEQMYSVNDGGIFLTTDIQAPTVNWINKSMGYVSTQLYTVTIDEKNAYDQWILGGFQDNGNYITHTNQVKSNWRMTINGDGAYNYISPDKSFGIISTQLGNIRKVTFDKFGNILARKRIDPAGYEKEQYNFINAFVVNPNNNNYLYLALGKKLAIHPSIRNISVVNNLDKLSTGWYFSSDTIKAANLGTGNTIPAEITAIGVALAPSTKMYIGTSSKHIYRIENALSTNPKFILTDTIGLPTKGNVSSIYVDPDNDSNVLVCYSNYNITSLYYTNNAGNKWYLVGGNLEGGTNSSGTNPSIRCVGILRKANGQKVYFAGTSVGLFSTDSLVLGTNAATNKTQWLQESKDLLGANIITDIKIRQVDGYIAIGTHGGGVFDCYYTQNESPVANVNADPAVQVFPNPASTEVNCTFVSVTGKKNKVYILDNFGNIVQKLYEDSPFQQAKYTLAASVNHLPSGFYFLVHAVDGQKKPAAVPFIIKH